MFKIGDAVIDTTLGENRIGKVTNIQLNETYSVIVAFPPGLERTYTKDGIYDVSRPNERKLVNIGYDIKFSPTHFCVYNEDNYYLLPVALTSFKIEDGTITATHSNKDYAIASKYLDSITNQILNPTKKESI